jgi:hypothetical protein
VPVDAFLTPRAEQQKDALRTRDRKSYDEWLRSLRAEGCKALHYRLTGEDLIERLCVVHLVGSVRVVVAFQTPETAVIVLIGPHQDDNPAIDVYVELYKLAGLDRPPVGERTKPPCCGADDEAPPLVDLKVVDDLFQRARKLSGADKRRKKQRR